jgi:hypothetical protein
MIKSRIFIYFIPAGGIAVGVKSAAVDIADLAVLEVRI